MDVALNPLSPIIAFRKRAFSDNPDIVIRHAEEMINVFKEDKILPVLKHFPGHGSALGDTHLGYVNITYDWQEIELKPYQELLPKHPEVGVMIAHVYHEKIDKKYPLSLSYQNVTENLKNKLNFKGLTFTDDSGLLFACLGIAARILPGSLDNVKITSAMDYATALQIWPEWIKGDR